MPQSFCERLIESFEARLDKTAMRIVGCDAGTYTFGELLGQVRAVAYQLKANSIEFGDRVALIGENHPKWAIAYLGTLLRGAVIVPLDPHGEIETITNFLENSKQSSFFFHPIRSSGSRRSERNLVAILKLWSGRPDQNHPLPQVHLTDSKTGRTPKHPKNISTNRGN